MFNYRPLLKALIMVLMGALVGILGACKPADTTPSTHTSTSTSASYAARGHEGPAEPSTPVNPNRNGTPTGALADVPAGSPAALLGSLPVKGRAPKTGYSREQFGQAWTDDVDVPGGHNGCDTRNDILARDMTNVVFKNHGHCAVASGDLYEPYSGKQVHFVRGAKTSMLIQIDHYVALSDAWQTGAQQLSKTQRTQLANDPLELVAVDGELNQQKSDADAASWLPPNKNYRKIYVTRQIQVKAKYHLWVTTAEKQAMLAVLNS